MSFETILKDIVADGPDVLAAALVGDDGLVIAQERNREISEGALNQWDIAALGVEFEQIFSGLARTSKEMGVGGVAEFMVRLERLTLIVSRVEEDVLLVVGLAMDGNIGKARYLMRRNHWAIREEI